MSLVATLIAHPSNPAVTPELVDRASVGVVVFARDWLAPGIACDLRLGDGQIVDNVRQALAQNLANDPVDIVVQETTGRKKNLLIADMDSTMIGEECVDELAAEAGVYDHVADITRRAMNGEIEFESAMSERVSLLKGLDLEDQVIAEAIMRGLQNPATLPDPGQQSNPALAAPGLAHMIHAAASDPQALILISNMAEQMSKAGGDMARLASIMRPLINGERDPDRLCKGMDERGEALTLDILQALAQIEEQAS